MIFLATRGRPVHRLYRGLKLTSFYWMITEYHDSHGLPYFSLHLVPQVTGGDGVHLVYMHLVREAGLVP